VIANVDASNLHLLLFSFRIIESYEYYGGKKANINYEKCTNCGICKINAGLMQLISKRANTSSTNTRAKAASYVYLLALKSNKSQRKSCR